MTAYRISHSASPFFGFEVLEEEDEACPYCDQVPDHSHCEECGAETKLGVTLCEACRCPKCGHVRDFDRATCDPCADDAASMELGPDSLDDVEHAHREMDHAAFCAFEYREDD